MYIIKLCLGGVVYCSLFPFLSCPGFIIFLLQLKEVRKKTKWSPQWGKFLDVMVTQSMLLGRLSQSSGDGKI